MENIASWVAPIATAIAACMTAANLGARVTGWGFVVFTIGSIAWTAYAAVSGQTNLLWQNLFLTAVNLIGIWRWLGRQAKLDDGAQAASDKSEVQPGAALVPMSRLTDADLLCADGTKAGTVVDAMIRREDGAIDFLVMARGGLGGVGETLHALPWARAQLERGAVATDLDAAGLDALDPVDPADWPARPRPA